MINPHVCVFFRLFPHFFTGKRSEFHHQKTKKKKRTSPLKTENNNSTPRLKMQSTAKGLNC